MTSTEKQWPKDTPEHALADAFSAFRHRDVARLTAAVMPSQASIVGRVIGSLPEVFTESVRCLVVGRVLESRLVDTSPDGRGLIHLECRIAGADDEWVSVDGSAGSRGDHRSRRRCS